MFLHLSGRVLPKEISLWNGKLGKDHPPSGGGCHASSWGSDETNRWREGKPLSAWAETLPSAASDIHCLGCLRFSWVCINCLLSWLSSLQMANEGLHSLWESMGADSCNCSLIAKLWFFCDPVDWILPGSSAHGILQVRILEWVAVSFSRGSSSSRDWTHVSCLAGRFFTTEPPGKPNSYHRSPLLYLYVCCLSVCLSAVGTISLENLN